MPIRALLFDFDGLILDTETASRAGWERLYREHGHELPADRWRSIVGTTGAWSPMDHLEELVGGPLQREALNERRYAHEISMIEAEELRPGIAEYLEAATRLGLKRAIVSSSSRAWIDLHLARLERDVGWDAIVTADHDPARAKPSPALYLETLDLLGVAAHEAIVLEDSPNGVKAARAAGIFVVAVPNEVTREYGLDDADLVVDSLAELPPDELLARFREVARPRGSARPWTRAGNASPREETMSAYRATHIDDIAAEQWPYWAPIRHHFDIRTFGANAWRGSAGDEVIKRHDEHESGAPELYVVMSGHATFTIEGDDVDAPAGTLVFVRDATAERVAFAKEDGTVVLSIGAAAEGQAFAPAGWDTSYLEGA